MYRIAWTTKSGLNGYGQFIYQTEKEALNIVSYLLSTGSGFNKDSSGSKIVYWVECDSN